MGKKNKQTVFGKSPDLKTNANNSDHNQSFFEKKINENIQPAERSGCEVLMGKTGPLASQSERAIQWETGPGIICYCGTHGFNMATHFINRNYFMESARVSAIGHVSTANSFNFRYKTNECENPIQSAFHAVICLF